MQTCEIDNTSASVTFHLAARVRTERLDSVVDSVMELVRSMPCRCDGLEDVELALRKLSPTRSFTGITKTQPNRSIFAERVGAPGTSCS